jgi:hypothetical protein
MGRGNKQQTLKVECECGKKYTKPKVKPNCSKIMVWVSNYAFI